MNPESLATLHSLLHERNIAALGTLEGDEPYVSMVPFAVDASGRCLIIHTSRLAAHTQNMMRNNRVSLLISEPESSGKMAQSLARVTIQGVARVAVADDADYPKYRADFLRRFPNTAPMFGFADFHLFRIEVTSARLVAGFAQAMTLNAANFAAAVADGERSA